MIDLRLIGIGTGNPDHLTREADKAMRAADVILLPRKRSDTADLIDLRRMLCAGLDGPRIAEFDLPVRATDAPYPDAVEGWHDAIAGAWRTEIIRHLPAGGTLALLIWGDPSLYDSSLRIAARLKRDGMAMRVGVVPGITSLQALTAAHAIPLNRIASPVAITTGRRLRDHGWPSGFDTIAVMLDKGCAFDAIDPAGVEIWWGAYLGMAQQALAAGPLQETGEEIRDRRAALRAEHGWIMDVYLLRRAMA
ncbi:precorrin-6A synthase (deacetylating) [Stakelama pacifica]|uniref:Precorrin-6A synthase [deacetylating] n=1 Tax=Stakelama pacifica TaxID=517720 RepID=A0A4R6FAR7_9SPHN|nr:precorrin-6A synthase (deacetylating) [Stakelama pacifica]TDN78087.1 precorrin-6A synthase (deacetylating) [Stakelama pacifica]GGP00387.1 precorrin-6A synthase (deacetylating) [Stakelama pacifica]